MTLPVLFKTLEFGAVSAAIPWWLTGGVPSINCIAAYQPKGAADLAASYINLANPGTYDAAPGVAPTFNTATGWTANSSKYLLTGIVPDTGWSFIARFSNLYATGGLCVLGLANAAFNNVYALYPGTDDDGGSTIFYHGTVAGRLKVAGRTSAGVMAMAGNACYIDAVSKGNAIGASTPTLTIWLLALNYNNGLNSGFNGNLLAVAIYNIDISSYVAALTTAMNAL